MAIRIPSARCPHCSSLDIALLPSVSPRVWVWYHHCLNCDYIWTQDKVTGTLVPFNPEEAAR